MSGDRLAVLVVGSGGREHALAAAIAASPRCGRLLVAPGNGGTPGERLDVAPTDVAALVAVAEAESIDLVVIGPEAPLDAGLADALAAAGIAVFGPHADVARLEASKAHTRLVADTLGIPSPRHARFPHGAATEAIEWMDAFGSPVVVKQSGLAGGKGVVVPGDRDDALLAIEEFAAIGEVVLEERLVGTEVSLIALCDGSTSVPLPLAQDHKRIGEGDVGANTGGMGAYAPAPVAADAAALHEAFITPIVRWCAERGTPYVGALYAGLMLTADGPRLLEYNCRFGDPEAQVLLPLVEGDVLEILLACAEGRLADTPVVIRDGCALGVVVAAEGYPDTPTTGDDLVVPASLGVGESIFHAATDRHGDRLVSTGGRVLTCVGVGTTLSEARARAYRLVDRVSLRGARIRRDIGWRAPGAALRSYGAAGVDIEEGTRAVELMSRAVRATESGRVLRGIGAFGGAIDASFLKDFDSPVLVGSTDGVGTKVELAARTGRLRGVGIDIVNHCVNDVLVQRAFPLFFLDYLASSHLVPEHVADVVGGMSEACIAADCVLLGGETAEMPGVYAEGAFDVAGTLVGVAERGHLLPRDDVASGDLLVGLASSGPHTNGYSYLRRLFEWVPLDSTPPPLDRPLVDALLEPHRSYLSALTPALATNRVKALVHVTGGGLPDNLPRALPSGLGATVRLGSWPVPPLFRLVRELSALDDDELHRTLNMGVGMVVVCSPADADVVRDTIPEATWVIGEVTDAHSGVRLVRP